jgi:hypothetical protein
MEHSGYAGAWRAGAGGGASGLTQWPSDKQLPSRPSMAKKHAQWKQRPENDNYCE